MFQDMHIVMLPILVVALMREEKIWNKTLGICIHKSIIRGEKKLFALFAYCNVTFHNF